MKEIQRLRTENKILLTTIERAYKRRGSTHPNIVTAMNILRDALDKVHSIGDSI